tara:strand:- start:16502 stop:18697 length:2196 start_codon:yes stop_codon:yes gene_type:complete
MAEINSPGYIESVGSSKRKTKEDLRISQIIPSEILDATGDTGIKLLLEKYYEFMNMNEFIYDQTETFTDLILDGVARFRISDPDNENNMFFTDEQGNSSTIRIVGQDSNSTTVDLNTFNVSISNGNELPGSLKNSTSEIGKTLTVSGLAAYNGETATLSTPVKHWVGPGPSYILNAIEDFMDIDKNSSTSNDDSHDYLEMMQKEIASAIPEGLLVNKNTLYKRIVDFYKIRGSADSIATFFRLLFNESVELERPYDNTLIPSSGDWSPDINQFVSLKGFISEKKIRIHDSYRYQKYSYLIKTGKNLSDWDYTFNRLVHPAGFIFFGEILILINMVRDALGDGKVEKGINIQVKSAETGNLITQLINVYGRDNRFTLSSMPGIQPGVIGAEDLPLLVEMFISTFGPTPIARICRNAIMSATVSGGAVTDLEIVRTGHGYTSPPVISISGTGTNATATCTLNNVGEIETVTVTAGGSGYTEASVSVAAPVFGNGTLSDIRYATLSNNVYRTAPIIHLSAPTAVDQDGVLLTTNVQATAEFSLQPVGVELVRPLNSGANYTSEPIITISMPNSGTDRATARATINDVGEVDGIYIINKGSGYTSVPQAQVSGGGGTGATTTCLLIPTQLSGINITNRGNGYVVDPVARLSSSMITEKRAKATGVYLKIMLNHLLDGTKTIDDNDYFKRKGTTYYDSAKKFNLNQSIDTFADQTIQSNNIDSINRYNTNSFIDLN